MPRLSKIGAACLAAFGWTTGAAVEVEYLVVAGGGGGAGAGGGAGGYQTGTTSINPTQSYAVTVGGGGAGTSSVASNGIDGSKNYETIISENQRGQIAIGDLGISSPQIFYSLFSTFNGYSKLLSLDFNSEPVSSPTYGPLHIADLNGDGIVNGEDLGLLLMAWTDSSA